MTNAERQSLIAIPAIVAIAAGVAWAGSYQGVTHSGFPLFAIAAVLAFAINWLAFVAAYLRQTERYFDLTGSLTYLALVFVTLALGGITPRSLLLGAIVCIWAVRLGSFLFARISRDGADGRFDVLKPSLPRFLMTWTLQALWVFLTLSCALAAMTSGRAGELDAAALTGALLWAIGFGIEVLADSQKQRFRADPANRDCFIQSGLWAWSRHPNYFGEIMLWVGVAVIALPALSGWQYLTLVSPVFVYVLLTRISGIPMLESRASRRWGQDPSYRSYKQRTPALLLKLPQTPGS